MSTYSLQVNKGRTSLALSYFGQTVNFKKLLRWYGATGENRNFEYKEDIATTQILNLNTKTSENEHFIHYLERFPQTLSVCFWMPTSKHKYQCFLILVQSFSACTFSRIYASTVSNTNFYEFGHIFFSFKWPKQEAKTKPQQNKTTQNKKPRGFPDEPSVSQRNSFWHVVTGTLRWLPRLHCLLYFLAFDWLRPAVLFSLIGQFAYL